MLIKAEIKAAISLFFITDNASHDYLYVKGVPSSEKPIENYYLTLQRFIASFKSLFWFAGDFTVLVQSQGSHLYRLQKQQAAVSMKKL